MVSVAKEKQNRGKEEESADGGEGVGGVVAHTSKFCYLISHFLKEFLLCTSKTKLLTVTSNFGYPEVRMRLRTQAKGEGQGDSGGWGTRMEGETKGEGGRQ